MWPNATPGLSVSQFTFFILYTNIYGSYPSRSVSVVSSECGCWLRTTAACSGETVCLSPSIAEVVDLSSRSAWGLSADSHCRSSQSSCCPADPWLWICGCPGVRQVWTEPCRCKWGNASLRHMQVERHYYELFNFPPTKVCLCSDTNIPTSYIPKEPPQKIKWNLCILHQNLLHQLVPTIFRQ